MKITALIQAVTVGLLLLLISIAITPGCTSIDVPGTAAPGAGLQVGSEAPPLQLAEFVQGDPVESIQAGQVYVVEFWATWCPPCVKNMPHLGKLQQRYGDKVTFIGVSNEDRTTVESFLNSPYSGDASKKMGQVAHYRIALDDNLATNINYMEAAGQNAIPCAFIVGRDSKIRWIGHPAEIDRTLAAVVNE